MTPGQPPKIGTSSIMKGKYNAPKWPGYSKTIHYEITGAGRIDYHFNPSATEGARRDLGAATWRWAADLDLGNHGSGRQFPAGRWPGAGQPAMHWQLGRRLVTWSGLTY